MHRNIWPHWINIHLPRILCRVSSTPSLRNPLSALEVRASSKPPQRPLKPQSLLLWPLGLANLQPLRTALAPPFPKKLDTLRDETLRGGYLDLPGKAMTQKSASRKTFYKVVSA